MQKLCSHNCAHEICPRPRDPCWDFGLMIIATATEALEDHWVCVFNGHLELPNLFAWRCKNGRRRVTQKKQLHWGPCRMRIVFSLEELREAELAKHSHLNHESMDNFNNFYGKMLPSIGSHKSMRSRNGGSHILDPFNWQCCQGRQIACQLADGKRQNLSKKRNTMRHIQMHLEFGGLCSVILCSMNVLCPFWMRFWRNICGSRRGTDSGERRSLGGHNLANSAFLLKPPAVLERISYSSKTEKFTFKIQFL